MEQSRYRTAQRPPGAESFRLIETMRFEPGRGVRHADRHAARLARSARHFGFPFFEDAFHAEVQTATAPLREGSKATHQRSQPSHDEENPRRRHKRPPSEMPSTVRLMLGAEGDLQSEDTPLDEAERDDPLQMTMAEARADSADPFFRHKTTWRRVYRRAFEAAHERGADEALLLNERGEVTEGTRANIFMEKNGAFYTPPVRCGLLPGVGRGVWLDEAGAEERVLRPADLRSADALWLVSALRGRRRAVMRGA
jgi:para-aminobenzoate synthetase/4-amino-4-deoxychorismate lyase